MSYAVGMNRSEFEISLLKPIAFWGSKTEEEVRALLGNEVASMVHYDQRNPHHVYDLFTHTLHVVSGLPFSAPITLRAAAFFHDIGKPAAACEKHGHLVFYNHAEKSVEMAAPILERLEYTEAEKQIIIFYIRYHDVFITWVLPSEKPASHYQREITRENVQKEMKKVIEENEVFQREDAGEIWKNLVLLMKADLNAQADQVYRDGKLIDTKGHKMQKLNLIDTYVQEVGAYFGEGNMTEFNDQHYYEYLRITPDAGREVIEEAFKRLIKKYHPDNNSSPDAVEKMKNIIAAYNVLMNQETRKRYDAWLKNRH